MLFIPVTLITLSGCAKRFLAQFVAFRLANITIKYAFRAITRIEIDPIFWSNYIANLFA